LGLFVVLLNSFREISIPWTIRILLLDYVQLELSIVRFSPAYNLKETGLRYDKSFIIVVIFIIGGSYVLCLHVMEISCIYMVAIYFYFSRQSFVIVWVSDFWSKYCQYNDLYQNVVLANGVHWALIVQGNVALVIGATSLLRMHDIDCSCGDLNTTHSYSGLGFNIWCSIYALQSCNVVAVVWCHIAIKYLLSRPVCFYREKHSVICFCHLLLQPAIVHGHCWMKFWINLLVFRAYEFSWSLSITDICWRCLIQCLVTVLSLFLF